MSELQAVLMATVSPDISQRRQAESHLLNASKTPGYPIIVLSLIASQNPAHFPVKQIASIHFKNLVRKGWAGDDDDVTSGRYNKSSKADNNDTTPYVINDVDRPTIKQNLVEVRYIYWRRRR